MEVQPGGKPGAIPYPEKLYSEIGQMTKTHTDPVCGAVYSDWADDPAWGDDDGHHGATSPMCFKDLFAVAKVDPVAKQLLAQIQFGNGTDKLWARSSRELVQSSSASKFGSTLLAKAQARRGETWGAIYARRLSCAANY